jgi:hypothetical protein
LRSRAKLMRFRNLRIHSFLAVLFSGSIVGGLIMSGSSKAGEAQPVEKTDQAEPRPTVTTTGQVMWSTRDLLFPSGHPVRSASRPQKKR